MKKIIFSLILIFSLSLIFFTACEFNNAINEPSIWNYENAYAYAVELGYEGTLEEFIAKISGADGVGIEEISLSDDGELMLSDNSEINLGSVKGEPGRSILSIVKTSTDGLIDTYTITYTDNITSTFTVTNGAPGEPGIQGIQGEKGEDGHTPIITIGTNGNWIIDGVDTGVKVQGLSAYEIFKKYNPDYTGTEEEWVAHISQNMQLLDFYPLFDGSEYGVTEGKAKFLSKITIPATYSGFPVTTIYGLDCPNLEVLIIPDSITAIPAHAIRGKSNLIVLCEAQSKPDGWDSLWVGEQVPVIWNYGGGKIVYLINSNAEAGSVSGTGEYAQGSTVTITATANDEYQFDGWYDGDNPVSTSEEYTFTMPEKNLFIEARWKALPAKSNLYISNFNGALRDEWLLAAIERFEQIYADTSFEQGKIGIKVSVINNRDILYDSSQLSDYDIFFAENAKINDEYLLDLTDLLNEVLSEFGENKTLREKISPDAVKPSGNYSLPNYSAFGGIVYDIDLFEEHNYSVPSTYEEFFQLCDVMVQDGITPFIWSGTYAHGYTELLLNALLADYSGKDEMTVNYTMDGTISIINSINNGNPITEIVQITEANGYEIFSQEGRYYALKFLEEILSNSSYCSPSCFNSTVSHIDAQEIFLYSRFNQSKPIAMLIDGSWWQNEADYIFNEMEGIYGESASKESRRFGFMPMPAATNDKIGKKNTLLNISNSQMFIKKDAANADIAKMFLKFLYTDESLIEFTSITGLKRSASYEIPGYVFNALTYFEKDVLNICNDSDIVNAYAKSDFVKQYEDYFNTGWMAVIENMQYLSPLYAINNNNKTAEEYFNGIIYGHNNPVNYYNIVNFMFKDGSTDYVIVIPSDASDLEVYAAGEFQSLFEEATGYTLSIYTDNDIDAAAQKIISIGNTLFLRNEGIQPEYEELGPDGIRILTLDNKVYLFGAGDNGTLFSVYEYLSYLLNFEQYSANCYTLDKGVTKIVFKNLNIIDVPDIPMRAGRFTIQEGFKNSVSCLYENY